MFQVVISVYFCSHFFFSPHLRFNNLVLISPHGLPGELEPDSRRSNFLSTSHCYSQDELSQVSLRSAVNVVCAKMLAISRYAYMYWSIYQDSDGLLQLVLNPTVHLLWVFWVHLYSLSTLDETATPALNDSLVVGLELPGVFLPTTKRSLGAEVSSQCWQRVLCVIETSKVGLLLDHLQRKHKIRFLLLYGYMW